MRLPRESKRVCVVNPIVSGRLRGTVMNFQFFPEIKIFLYSMSLPTPFFLLPFSNLGPWVRVLVTTDKPSDKLGVVDLVPDRFSSYS